MSFKFCAPEWTKLRLYVMGDVYSDSPNLAYPFSSGYVKVSGAPPTSRSSDWAKTIS
jgi:hypothetical protein